MKTKKAIKDLHTGLGVMEGIYDLVGEQLNTHTAAIAQNDKWITALKTHAEKQTAAIKKLQANITTLDARLDSQAEALATCTRRLAALETTK